MELSHSTMLPLVLSHGPNPIAVLHPVGNVEAHERRDETRAVTDVLKVCDRTVGQVGDGDL